MRIHTNLSYSEVSNMISGMPGVYFEILDERGSRSRDRAFEVQLRGNSSRRPNNRGRDNGFAATWDEWGIFLNRIFEKDATAMMTYYKDASDFHYRTGNRFKTLSFADQHKVHRFGPTGVLGVSVCKCGAEQRWYSKDE